MSGKKSITVVIAAMAIHFGLSRLLAAAVTSGEERESRELSPDRLVPAQRAADPLVVAEG
ncbi:MAG TPA: hypothetical protein VKB14_03285 [Actinomycetales bacterium]|nr:hypothetical protein [Actinomycetales bacterium]